MMKYQIEIGMKVQMTPGREPWTLEKIIDHRCKLRQGDRVKWINDTSMMSLYYPVGSEKDKRLTEDWKRNKWEIWK